MILNDYKHYAFPSVQGKLNHMLQKPHSVNYFQVMLPTRTCISVLGRRNNFGVQSSTQAVLETLSLLKPHYRGGSD